MLAYEGVLKRRKVGSNVYYTPVGSAICDLCALLSTKYKNSW